MLSSAADYTAVHVAFSLEGLRANVEGLDLFFLLRNHGAQATKLLDVVLVLFRLHSDLLPLLFVAHLSKSACQLGILLLEASDVLVKNKMLGDHAVCRRVFGYVLVRHFVLLDSVDDELLLFLSETT